MRNRRPLAVLGMDVHPVRFSAAFRAAIAAALCAALFTCLAPAPAGATPELHWSGGSFDLGRTLSAVSCASNTLCAAIDTEDFPLISTNPAAGAGATWTRAIATIGHLIGVSCTGELCAAITDEALYATENAFNWSGANKIDDVAALTGISCASRSLCVAVDAKGDVLYSSSPVYGSWSTPLEIDKGNQLTSVSCASSSLCVAVDNAGQAFVSNEPSSGIWHARTIDSNPKGLNLVSVSCAPAPADVCVAVNNDGEALATGDPSAGLPGTSTATWSATPVDTQGAPTGVSCTAGGLCVLVDSSGDAYVGDDPATAEPSWRLETIDSSGSLSAVSCESEGLCAAVGAGGKALVTQVPAPTVVATSPSAVAETTAALTGTVDTNDATLSSCRFEYGTSESYGHSAPCPTALAAGSANQPVSAELSGLAANVTYDYRLVATSASGEGSTANATFKTTAPPLVQPHPSISGIPAPGQHLTCKSGVSGSGASSATLSYAWLRDTKAISGANGSSYLVVSGDVSHHLQCRVSATNAGGSMSATSAFVTVPAGGLGAISETQVGAPHVAGRTVSVPVACSAQAAGSCTIRLRLTVVETLRGKRVIAVAARRTSHKTVTVGSVAAHVPAGRHATVTVALNATGRGLLAHLHKLTAKLSVSGTVVGAISAQLRSATVTLGVAGKASSRHRR
jgi:hypothetical protein